jgi:hypothetical protein
VYYINVIITLSCGDIRDLLLLPGAKEHVFNELASAVQMTRTESQQLIKDRICLSHQKPCPFPGT